MHFVWPLNRITLYFTEWKFLKIIQVALFNETKIFGTFQTKTFQLQKIIIQNFAIEKNIEREKLKLRHAISVENAIAKERKNLIAEQNVIMVTGPQNRLNVRQRNCILGVNAKKKKRENGFDFKVIEAKKKISCSNVEPNQLYFKFLFCNWINVIFLHSKRN